MKNRKAIKKADFSLLIRKLYLYVLIALAAAFTLVLCVLWLVQENASVGDWVVSFMQHSFHLREADALTVYRRVILNNKEIIICAAAAVCFFIFLRVIVSKFMGYFDEVNNGIDTIINGEDTQLELSDEMGFMEQKLNVLKQTLEKREQNARLAEQHKNDLVMYLAHDIKTPLTSVIGYLSLLDEAPDMPMEQRARYARITLDKAYRLERLIDEFFEIARYNYQSITLSKKDIDLYYMFVQMADEFYPQLSVSGKQTIIHAPEDLTVYGDPDKLARVFNNVLKNAVSYSPDDSIIKIEASVAGDTVTVVITNAGCIPKDKLDSIFDKFYRLDAARSTVTGGAGLGLAIAKEIVVLHGGSIYARSDDNNTAFVVELPARAKQT